MGDIQITGTEEFIRVAKALNAQGSGGRGMKRELMAAVKLAAKPMEKDVRANVTRYLPDRYARVMEPALVVKPSQSTRGSSVGLKLTAYAKGKSRRRRVGTINDGTLRRPVYGNRNNWVAQRVKPGFWSEQMEKAREKPAREIRRAIQRVADKIARG